MPCSLYTVQSYNFCNPCRSLFLEEFPTFTGEGFDQVLHHTGQCKITGGCYNELVVAIFRTGACVKGKKSIPVDSIKVSEYDQEIPQSQIADSPMSPRGRVTQPSRVTRKTNKAKQPALSSPSR